MQDNAGERIFGICIDGTSAQTIRIETVVTTHREIVPSGMRPFTSLNFTNAPPMNCGRIAVLLVTGDFTGTATDALCHVEVKAVLLTGAREAIRYQRSALCRCVRIPGRHAYKAVAGSNALM
jgi:hypothetical protein